MSTLKGNKNAIKRNANFLRTRTLRRLDCSSLSAPDLLAGPGKSTPNDCFSFCKMGKMSLIFIKLFET